MSEWLLLAVRGTRQHGGNDGYADEPDRIYRWDSTVPHHADLQIGDRIAVWDKVELLGAAVITRIDRKAETKPVYRCAHCKLSGIKRRTTLTPQYMCYKCRRPFEDPIEEWQEVTSYCANYHRTWVDLKGVLAASDLRPLCESPKSQLSMRPLDWGQFLDALSKRGHARACDTLESHAAIVQEVARTSKFGRSLDVGQ